jgi:hypothetical protein
MRIDSKGLEKGLESLSNKSDIKIKNYLSTTERKLDNYAKKNAPWKNHSGRARLGLHSYTEKTPFGYRLIIAHGVDYGIWLELAHEKKYAILNETIQQNTNDIMKGFTKLIERA